MRQAIVTYGVLLTGIVSLSVLSGCERPPKPETTEATPPEVVHVAADSPEGKALLAEQRKSQRDTPEQAVSPAASATSGAPEANPTTASPMTPAAVPMTPAAPPTTPAPPMTPATTPGTGGASVPGTNAVMAASQVGRRADDIGQGLVATPIGAYFTAQEQIAIKIQLENELKVYAAINGPPKNTQELMDKVVKPARIKLPELRPGEKYFFDPKQGLNGTLMIQQPAGASKP